MRLRIFSVGAVALALGLSMGTGTVAAPNKSFEATISAPAHNAGPELFADACPEPGEHDGLTYAFFDLKGEFKHFKAYGPEHLFNEPSPAYHDANDYDIDMYAFDRKCKEITPSDANGPAGTERFETRRPARYVVIAYWSGIYKDLPVTLEVSHTKIK